MLAEVEQRSCGDDGFCSVKIMANYARVVEKQLCVSKSVASSQRYLGVLADLYRDSAWVFISRHSKVRQAISRVLSEKRGINHVLSREGAPFIPGKAVVWDADIPLPYIDVDPDDVAKHCLAILCEEEIWERFFLENHITPLRIIYEEIAISVDYIQVIGAMVGKSISIPRTDRMLVRVSDQSNEVAYSRVMARNDDVV